MPLTVADRLAMIELIGRYNQAIDSRNGEGWADTFTTDGAFEMAGCKPIKGRAAPIALVDSMGNNTPPPTRHWVTNFRFEGEGDEATMLADLAVLKQNVVVASGRYVNSMQRVEGEWKFRHRLYTGDS